jgi:type II secretory pathway predicted ATPase ExeA
MRRTIQKSLLKRFGLEKLGFFWNRTCLEFKGDIIDAIEQNQMLCLAGAVGAGKSLLFNTSIAGMDDIQFVHIRNYFKEKLNIAGIMNAMIYDLSDESPRRDLEARSRQLVKIAGKKYVSEKIKICLIIEEAHRIHANTLRALKELRESSFADISPLFSVILIGHPELVTKLESRKEAYWRSQLLEMNEANGWFTLKERLMYIKRVFGEAITQKARERIIILQKSPLAIDFYVEAKMKEAQKAGKRIIDEEVVQPSNRELKEACEISLKEIAAEVGLGKSTVHNAVNDEEHPHADAVKKAINKLNTQKIKKSA